MSLCPLETLGSCATVSRGEKLRDLENEKPLHGKTLITSTENFMLKGGDISQGVFPPTKMSGSLYSFLDVKLYNTTENSKEQSIKVPYHGSRDPSGTSLRCQTAPFGYVTDCEYWYESILVSTNMLLWYQLPLYIYASLPALKLRICLIHACNIVIHILEFGSFDNKFGNRQKEV